MVVDASVAVQWVAPERDSHLSEAVLHTVDLIAPELLQIEVANALRKKIAVGDVTADQARQAYRFIGRFVDIRPMSLAWLNRALDLSVAMSHPIYDCIYLAQAEQANCRLITRDRAFIERAEEFGMGHLIAPFPAAEVT